jgi:hypothetical protein
MQLIPSLPRRAYERTRLVSRISEPGTSVAVSGAAEVPASVSKPSTTAHAAPVSNAAAPLVSEAPSTLVTRILHHYGGVYIDLESSTLVACVVWIPF